MYAVPVLQDAFEARALELFWKAVDYEWLEARGLLRELHEVP